MSDHSALYQWITILGTQFPALSAPQVRVLT